MRLLLTLVILAISLNSFSQKEYTLKKKYFGKYKGTISSYVMDTEEEIIQISETAIYISIDQDEVSITVGNNTTSGTYEVMFKAQSYYLIDVTIPNQDATERIMVYKRGKKIARDGLHPQPVVELEKM